MKTVILLFFSGMRKKMRCGGTRKQLLTFLTLALKYTG
jgi:hypothetical protein